MGTGQENFKQEANYQWEVSQIYVVSLFYVSEQKSFSR